MTIPAIGRENGMCAKLRRIFEVAPNRIDLKENGKNQLERSHPKKKVIRIGSKRKPKLTAKVEMIQALIPRGLRSAIRKVFADKAIVQRCQWHKRENVVSYLPKPLQDQWRRKLQQAYEKPTYEEARASLNRFKPELKLINESALDSLEEGFEEILTLHRFGLFPQLGMSLNARFEKLHGIMLTWRKGL